MGEGGDKQLIQQLLRTSLYRDYERAFSAATGMPLALRGVEHWQMALHGNEHENQDRDVSLQDFAKTVNTSTFYFCKLFTKATGLTFTDYLSRVRIEKAKNLLLNPNLRISEVAYEVGFLSLTHFNRMFRKLTGQSPSAWREALPGAR